jgi:hypothetical protein
MSNRDVIESIAEDLDPGELAALTACLTELHASGDAEAANPHTVALMLRNWADLIVDAEDKKIQDRAQHEAYAMAINDGSPEALKQYFDSWEHS